MAGVAGTSSLSDDTLSIHSLSNERRNLQNIDLDPELGKSEVSVAMNDFAHSATEPKDATLDGAWATKLSPGPRISVTNVDD